MTDSDPDVNELARRLKHSARLAGVGKVAAGAAHELNQPLNVIRMAAYNLKRAIEKNTLDPAVALEKLARIDDQIASGSSYRRYESVFTNGISVENAYQAKRVDWCRLGVIGEAVFGS